MPFGEDPFDEIVREFFGKDIGRGGLRRQPGKRVYRGPDSELSSDYIQTPKNVYLVLDLSNKKVVDVKVKDNPSEEVEEGFQNKKILEIVFSDDEKINYFIPKDAKTNKFDWTFENGMLEVKFRK